MLWLGKVVTSWLIDHPEDSAQDNKHYWQICWILGFTQRQREVRWSPQDDGERAKRYQQWVALLWPIQSR